MVLIAILISAAPSHAQIGNLGPIGRDTPQSRKGGGGPSRLSVAIQPAYGKVSREDPQTGFSYEENLAALSLGISVDVLRGSLSPAVTAVLRAGGLMSTTFLTDGQGADFVDRFEEFSALLGPEVALRLGTPDMPVAVSPFAGVGIGPSYERLLSSYGVTDNSKKFGLTTGWRFGVEVTPTAMPVAFAVGVERHARDFEYAYTVPGFGFEAGKIKLKHSSTFLAIRFMFNQ